MSSFELALGKETKMPNYGLYHSHGTKRSFQGSYGDGQKAQREICPRQKALGASSKMIWKPCQ